MDIGFGVVRYKHYPRRRSCPRVRVAAVNDPPLWRVAPTAGLRTAEDTPLRLGGAVAVVDADVGEAGGVGDGLVAVRERRRERGLPSSQRPSSRNNIFTGSFALSAYTSGTAASLWDSMIRKSKAGNELKEYSTSAWPLRLAF